jgi:hypothetical protein
MLVTKSTRQTAIVNHTAQYGVDEKYWQSLLSQGLTEEEALEEAQSAGKANSVSFETEMVESVQVHEADVNCYS